MSADDSKTRKQLIEERDAALRECERLRALIELVREQAWDAGRAAERSVR